MEQGKDAFSSLRLPTIPDQNTQASAPGEGGWYSRFTPEPIVIIEQWGLNHHIASALAYMVRADAKNGIEDIDKAIWYLERYKSLLTKQAQP